MELQPRKVIQIIEPQPVIEGAGVRLKRSFPTHIVDYLDPFLLLDHFVSDNPEDYLAGFPMHPHRGIETVTYILAGVVHHRDSLGNSGSIGAGDVQWMTSGHGIMHEEMPKPRDGKMAGFQLWVNLPPRLKMTRPRYQEVPAKRIPVIQRPDGVKIRVIAGSMDGVQGPVTDIAADPAYLDVSLPVNISFSHSVERGHTVFAYVFEGEGMFGISNEEETVFDPKLVVFGDGDHIMIRTTRKSVRLLLVAGKSLNEPIARYGPFVMNTREEIEQALQDLREGTFVQP
ncbi:MAG: pirin family protein [Anaerolineales bacterium]|nr:pirin family protein [Anaerolineales bacterium]